LPMLIIPQSVLRSYKQLHENVTKLCYFTMLLFYKKDSN
jgi:hypothetical protein